MNSGQTEPPQMYMSHNSPGLSGPPAPGPSYAPDRRPWHRASSAGWLPGKIGSNACPSPAHGSPRQTRISAPPHSGRCCPSG